MARGRMYKCSICKERIDIVNDEKNSFFCEIKHDQKKYYHCDCYTKYQMSKKRLPKTEEECESYIEECRSYASTYKKVIKKTTKDELYEYVVDMYDLSYVPTYFYVKFSQVFDGKYKGLKTPVPPEDLLDMWKQKRNYLLKNAETQRKRDKDINGLSRVWYDLAILLSKYDSYLKWKEQKKLAIAEIEEKKKESIEFVKYNDIAKQTIRKKNTNDCIDINAMLDEI